MQARLRAKLEAGRVDNVELVRAGFLSYEHAGEPADDGVFASYVLRAA